MDGYLYTLVHNLYILVRCSDLGALDIDFGLRDREASVTQAARKNACSSKDILIIIRISLFADN
jgi:hypothetical protein